ncbi:MAG: hypothetical protein KJ077_37850 [Anaerolineae bacterium]|nr:hypothetical protein [Anaerolineae bacterium]
MPDAISSYRMYLLTVWKDPQGPAPDGISALPQELPTNTGWRFFLEDPRTGQRRGFSNAVDLVAVLITEFGYGTPASDEPPPVTGETEPL